MSSAGIFYLIGVLVGFISRLRPDSTSSVAIEDYGLAHARLIQTPIFSGLAAVGGVLATFILSTAVNATVLTGQQAATHHLSDVFDIQKSLFNLVIAGAFGLAPQRLFDRLQIVADKYKTDIGSSEAAGSTQRAQI